MVDGSRRSVATAPSHVMIARHRNLAARRHSQEAIMGPIRLIAAPISSIARSRLVQLFVVVAVILLLDHYSYDYAALKPIAEGLQKVVTGTVHLCSEYFRIGILTDPVLQVGLMIAYVYVICVLVFYLLRFLITRIIDFVGWSNLFFLRNTIARERGIAAYRAWEPLERIRPDDISQDRWEATFAWPPDNSPPYPPLPVRMVRGAISYIVVFLIAAVILQAFTPFPVLTWLAKLTRTLVG
jgi:hypothetical protein